MAISCYIHVPFCARICTYCDFYRIVHDSEWETRYIQAICAEIALRSQSLESKLDSSSHPDHHHLSTLYFGGGTPTVLSEGSWRKLIGALTEHFEITPDTEFTSEANPESSSIEKLSLLRELGANRLSFGAQSFDAANLNRLGRLHNSAQIGEAVDKARSAGFTNLSLDLMYGLPDETDTSFDNDVRSVAALKPQHISMYSLMLEGNVPLRYQVQRGEVGLPQDDIVATRYIRGVDYLASQGFEHYEISNYALPGLQCKHNLAYWQHRNYLAFGPAAVGTLGGYRYKNEPDIYRYVRSLSQGRLPNADEEEITPGKKLIETIMLSLRLQRGLDYKRLLSEFKYDLFNSRKELIHALENSGDVVITDDRIELTTRGMFRSDMIASSLLPDFV